LKALIEKRLAFPKEQGILPVDSFWTQLQLCPWSLLSNPILQILNFPIFLSHPKGHEEYQRGLRKSMREGEERRWICPILSSSYVSIKNIRGNVNNFPTGY
jgi:hypothetical protein